jgi:hypothetical protein
MLAQTARLTALCLATLSAAWSADCRHVLSVAQVVRNASKLDGRVVCIRGMLVPSVIPDPSGVLIEQMVPLPGQRTTAPQAEKLGLMDWSPGMGIGEENYKPESFDLPALAALAKNPGKRYPVDVTVRAAVMYKRSLRAKVPPMLAPTPEFESMRHARHDVEIIMLEFLQAKEIDGKHGQR